ncbi:RIP metalloprotease RseP [Sphingomonas sp. Leaf343]|uniref:RIP metalloprotease RseP n=1 Tax=Sphingomonas sp. Leaf343 TaxID=1736345 RepID=UPI0006FF2B58|nr:RIP metalloprotease RseP [Sphingomonas sp. Leaf343]KQR83946.1 RIP metalloprotease RseP [Sphingomonas sp. Leaf343]
MIDTPGVPLTLLAFIGVIGPLVFIHEMGHYLAGRWFGVKAEAFSIGFGNEVAGWTDKRGTRWKLGWLPLGGYVRFAGDMTPASQPTAEWLALPADERARTFQAKPVWQRAIVVAAGPFVNFVAAILILAGFAHFYGARTAPPVVGDVVQRSPAAVAGLRAGDRLIALDGRAMESFADIAQFAMLRPAETVAVTYERGGTRGSTTMAIGVVTEKDRFGNAYRIGRIGIASPPAEYQPVSLIKAPLVGAHQVGDIVRGTLDTLGQIITGRRSVDELGGPIRIAKVSGEQMTLGWPAFIGLIALVSINLGFINLLPVPMLDGGHLLFYAIEAIRRRPVSVAVQEWAFRGGMAAILALMILVTFNDLGAFGLWRGLAGLIG